jgi:hypothetical protein
MSKKKKKKKFRISLPTFSQSARDLSRQRFAASCARVSLRRSRPVALGASLAKKALLATHKVSLERRLAAVALEALVVKIVAPRRRIVLRRRLNENKQTRKRTLANPFVPTLTLSPSPSAMVRWQPWQVFSSVSFMRDHALLASASPREAPAAARFRHCS